MLKRFRWFRGRGLLRNKKGFTLTEVVIAILVLGFVVASVPAALIAINNAQAKANEIRVAENLTRSQFEYVKSQDYEPGNVTFPLYEPIKVDSEFWLNVEAVPINPETGEEYERVLVGQVVLYEKDDGVQEITVTVYGYGTRPGQVEDAKALLVSKNYKVARLVQ